MFLQFVLLGSPPCTSYSRANTTGQRDLEAADELVAVMQLLMETLNCIVCVMENPATGLLPDREVRLRGRGVFSLWEQMFAG